MKQNFIALSMQSYVMLSGFISQFFYLHGISTFSIFLEKSEQSSEDMSTSEHKDEHAQGSGDVNNDAHDTTENAVERADSDDLSSSDDGVMQKTSSYFIDPDKADSSELELVTLVSS